MQIIKWVCAAFGRHTLQRNLSHDALKLPGRTLVEPFDVSVTFCFGLELWPEIEFEDGFEERYPGAEFTWLSEVGSHSNL